MSIENGNCGFDDGLWLFAILALFGGGGYGGFGGRCQEPYATHADVDRSMQFSALRDGQAGLAADVQRGIYEVNDNTKTVAYNNLSAIRDISDRMSDGFARQSECCCDLKTMIMENRYLDERNANNVISAVHAENEATRALIQQTERDRMRDEIYTLRNENSNYRQSDYMLNRMGRWAAYPPCETPCGYGMRS